MPFVRLGYLLSAFAKSIPFATILTPWVFTSRIADRFGKGVRTGARDALLADESNDDNKGKVFGFHRAMDTTRRGVGSFVRIDLSLFSSGDYRMLFLIAFFPAMAGVALTLIIREKKNNSTSLRALWLPIFFTWKKITSCFPSTHDWLTVFRLMNSSDALFFFAPNKSPAAMLRCYSLMFFYNAFYAMLAYPFGRLADAWGLNKMLVAGLLLFAFVYAGLSFAQNTLALATLLLIYGMYYAATEGISKALVSKVVPKTETASAIGFYTGCNSITSVLASPVAGWIWYEWSPGTCLLFPQRCAAGCRLAFFYKNGNAASKLTIKFNVNIFLRITHLFQSGVCFIHHVAPSHRGKSLLHAHH